MDNPFHLSGYVSSEFFCDREHETKRLLSSIQNGRNITLFANRRIGKTGLILNLFHLLEKKGHKCFYIDIMPTVNLADFVNTFGKAILGRLDKTPTKIIQKAKKIFSFLKPQLSIDPVTGEPSIQLNIEKEKEARYTLDEIFNYLANFKNEPITIAIDEFQQIGQYPESNIEELLRSKVQMLGNITFIFSGSQKHILLNMFANNNRPFYQSTEMMELGKIDPEKYSSFIEHHFTANKRFITKENAKWLLHLTYRHTYFVQYLCNRLFSERIKTIANDDISEQLKTILQENATIYYGYRSLLTIHQWKLLRAIARSGGADGIQGKAFIKDHDLGSSSTVKRSLESLIEKDMLYEEDSLYYLNDAFLSRWLEWF